MPFKTLVPTQPPPAELSKDPRSQVLRFDLQYVGSTIEGPKLISQRVAECKNRIRAHMEVESFNLEAYMRRGTTHLQSLVDSTGHTYFDVFLTRPAEAVHDWPDFVDLPSRYLEAAVMARQMLGTRITTEDCLRSRFFSTFEFDGLSYRPETPYSKRDFYIGENALALKTLNTIYMDNPQSQIARYIKGLIDGVNNLVTRIADYAFYGPGPGIETCFLIRPLLVSSLLLDHPLALDLAGRFSRAIMHHTNEFRADGSYSGHNHLHLGVLAGVLSYALVTEQPGLVDRVRQCFDFSVSISTTFGFVPEASMRADDLIACETCAIMDYLDVAILMARYVDPRYWDVVEKTARNHLVESQIKDGSWLSNAPYREDTNRALYRNVGEKTIGSFAGWSSPNHILAYEEELGPTWNWCKDETQNPYYLGKVRALQNCCAGSGLRAIFQVWRNTAYFNGEDAYVNLHIDKRLPDLVVVGYQPYQGRTTISLARACDLHIRIPSFANASQVRIRIDGSDRKFTVDGAYALLPSVKAGSEIEMRYPLDVRDESVTVGNKGYRNYRYSVKWKGDTVVQVLPDPNNARIGYTDILKRDTVLYYNSDGGAPLYNRSYLLTEDFKVRPAPAMVDRSAVNWYFENTPLLHRE